MRRRLASLRGTPTLADMTGLPGDCHALGADRVGQFSTSLWGPYKLVFAPADNPVPRTPDGGIDRESVRAISIIEVVDYHGR